MTGQARHRLRAGGVLVVLAACAGAADKPAAEPARPNGPVVLRGTLLARDSVTLAFVACGTTAERPVELRPGSRVMEAMLTVNGAVRDSVFMEVEADTSGGRLRARDARFARNFDAGSGCDRPHVMVELEATGIEPFWRVTVDGALLVLERAEAPFEIAFKADSPLVQGDLMTVLAHRADGFARELQLKILRTACHDAVGNAWYPFRAEVRFGRSAYRGCARRRG
jgi:uncharacterized membrane protein